MCLLTAADVHRLFDARMESWLLDSNRRMNFDPRIHRQSRRPIEPVPMIYACGAGSAHRCARPTVCSTPVSQRGFSTRIAGWTRPRY